MNEQLTLSIVGAYHGCEVKYYERIYSTAEFTSDGLGTALRLFVHNCKLVLTPLSAISDQDAIEVGKKFGVSKMDGHYYKWLGKAIITHLFTPCSAWDDSIFDNVTNRKIICDLSAQGILWCIDFLRASTWEGRSKTAYDIGHGPIRSLIAANLAVDKTTMK